MDISKVRQIAKANGIQTTGQFKADLIKAIQLREGNFDCFASAKHQQCDQHNCMWRQDCFEHGSKS